MNKLIAALLLICSIASAQTIRPGGGGGGFRFTNSPIPGATNVLVSDGTNFYYTTNITASGSAAFGAASATLRITTGKFINLTNTSRLITNWDNAVGTNLSFSIAGTNGFIIATNAGFYDLGFIVNYRTITNGQAIRTNQFTITTNVGGVGLVSCAISNTTVSQYNSNYYTAVSFGSVYLPSNTYVALSYQHPNGAPTNDLAVESGYLRVTAITGTAPGSIVSGGSGNLSTNADQFAANTVLNIKDGSLQTNNIFYGMTNNGSFSNAVRVDIGGLATIGASLLVVGNQTNTGDHRWTGGNLDQTGTGASAFKNTTISGNALGWSLNVVDNQTNQAKVGINQHLYVQGGYYVAGITTNANDAYFQSSMWQGLSGGATLQADRLQVSSFAFFTNNVTTFNSLFAAGGVGANFIDVTNDFRSRSNAYFFGTNTFYKTSRFVDVPTNRLFFQGTTGAGNTNLLGLILGANLSISGGDTLNAAGGAASTNNVVQAVETLIITNNYVNYWHAGVPGPVATTNWLYATNGDSQYYNLFAHTNIQYVPLAASDSSNHVGVAVAFTQNSTGGFYPTNAINNTVIPINTNANRSTMVYFSVANGVTNISVAYPFSMSTSATNGHVIEFNTATGTWTNIGSTGTGLIVREGGPTTTQFTNNGTLRTGALLVDSQWDFRAAGNVYGFNVTNNIGFVTSREWGTGTGGSNFTLKATGTNSIKFASAESNIVLTAIMNYDPTVANRGTLIVTNATASNKSITASSVTNQWLSLQQFDGIAFPIVVTNFQAGRLDWEILNTNVQYSYKPFLLPTNGF